jgi:hypothetical protein
MLPDDQEQAFLTAPVAAPTHHGVIENKSDQYHNAHWGLQWKPKIVLAHRKGQVAVNCTEI